jgi:hypothetical protein
MSLRDNLVAFGLAVLVPALITGCLCDSRDAKKSSASTRDGVQRAADPKLCARAIECCERIKRAQGKDTVPCQEASGKPPAECGVLLAMLLQLATDAGVTCEPPR